MDENILKTIKNKFDSLPERIKDTIMSSHYEDTLIEIGNFYKLNVEQMGIMEMETTMVMMGLTSPNDFETNLTHELGVDKIKGSEIAQAINEKVFLKIRELLKLMNTPQGEEPSLEESTEENENKILHSSGIEIISENKKETLPAVEKLELSTTKEEIKPIVPEKKEEEVHPVLAQKLTGFVKNEIKETDHALNNITKTNTPITPSEKPKIPSTDPYREIPE